MSKVILLSRVSTEKQTLEQQTNELFNEAIHLGYKEKNVIVIEDKESAISLDESERHGLTKLKEYINEDDTIDCVICYEVSRLSRRPKVLYSIRDFLLERKIQLVILKPYMKLLDNDGSMSQTASIMFSLFSSLSESEMMIKKERMVRGKHQKMKENKYGGGHWTMGYTFDENKNLIIDEEKAEIVKKIFNMYLSGLSIRKIAMELMQTGELEYKNLDIANSVVTMTLNRKQYYGDNSEIGYNYPPIISKEIFDKCREIAKQNRRKPKSKISFTYWCRGLMYDSVNGRVFTPSKANRTYQMHDLSTGLDSIISINVTDSLVWQVVREWVIFHEPEDNAKLKVELSDAIKTLKNKIKTSERKINDYEKQIDRIEKRIIEGKLDEFKGDRMEDDINNSIKEEKQNMDAWRHDMIVKENQLKELDDDLYLTRDLTMLNDDEIYELIKKTIDKIIVHKTKIRGTKVLDIHFKNGLIKVFTTKSQSKYPKIFDEYGEEYKVEWINRLPPRGVKLD